MSGWGTEVRRGGQVKPGISFLVPQPLTVSSADNRSLPPPPTPTPPATLQHLMPTRLVDAFPMEMQTENWRACICVCLPKLDSGQVAGLWAGIWARARRWRWFAVTRRTCRVQITIVFGQKAGNEEMLAIRCWAWRGWVPLPGLEWLLAVSGYQTPLRGC